MIIEQGEKNKRKKRYKSKPRSVLLIYLTDATEH